MSSNAIDNILNGLSDLTQTFIAQLEDKDSEEVEGFVEKRQLLVEQLHDALELQEMNDLQKEVLRHVLAYDTAIEKHISSLKDEAQEWLLQRNTAKTQRNVYESKYASDSYLIDKRK